MFIKLKDSTEYKLAFQTFVLATQAGIFHQARKLSTYYEMILKLSKGYFYLIIYVKIKK